jgi:lipopolysaccharide export system protein LptA
LAVLLAGVLAAGFLWPAPVPAQGQLARGADTDQPIKIDADSLEVQQAKNLAIFKGNVEAVQGRINIRANEIRVWYQGKDDKKAGKPAAAGDPASGSTIIRIDAIGKVFVSSPDETAQGDLGVYDVPGKRITLTGNVVLTRGENVIRGEKLILNIATGRSEIHGGKRRVHGIFQPPKDNKLNKGK